MGGSILSASLGANWCRGRAAPGPARFCASGGVELVMSPQLDSCELSSHELSSGGFCRAELTLRSISPEPAAQSQGSTRWCGREWVRGGARGGRSGIVSLSRWEQWSVGPGRRGERDGWAWGWGGWGLWGRPGRGVSKSATKALWVGVGCERRRGISMFLLVRSGSVGAFVADLDNPPAWAGRGGRPRVGRRALRAPRRSR